MFRYGSFLKDNRSIENKYCIVLCVCVYCIIIIVRGRIKRESREYMFGRECL